MKSHAFSGWEGEVPERCRQPPPGILVPIKADVVAMKRPEPVSQKGHLAHVAVSPREPGVHISFSPDASKCVRWTALAIEPMMSAVESGATYGS